MSDNYLRIIPEDPQFVPSAEAEHQAVQVLLAFIPESSVIATRTDEVQFIDNGENLERVLCPNCRADLTGFWPTLMDQAAVLRFSELRVETPCCHVPGDLNGLVYEWPAGFARFVLEVSGNNAGQFLPDVQCESVGVVIGCRVRQILSRY